jgi:hypothetical protein
VDVTGSTVLNGVGHVMFSNLVYQVGGVACAPRRPLLLGHGSTGVQVR